MIRDGEVIGDTNAVAHDPSAPSVGAPPGFDRKEESQPP